MPEQMEIEMPVSGAEGLKSALLAGAEAAERAAKAHERTEKAIKEAAKAAKSAGSGPFGRAESAQRAYQVAQSGGVGGTALADFQYRAERAQMAVSRILTPKPSREPAPIGPHGRLRQAQEAMERAKSGGASAEDLIDHQNRVASRQSMVDRLKPKNFSERLVDFVGTSRFSMGGMSPLVNRGVNLIGGAGGMARLAAGLANPITAVAALVAVAGKKLYEAMDKVATEAAEVGRRFAENRTIAGTGTLGAASLRAYGISGEQARSLSERIASDPAAMGMAQRFGAVSVGGAYGTLDSAPNTLKIVEGLRRLPERERLRAMRILGAESLAPLTRVSDATMGRLRGDAKTTSRIMDGDFEKRVAEFDVAKDRLEKAQENLRAAIGKRIFPALTWINNQLADTVNGLASFINGGQQQGANKQNTGASVTDYLDRNIAATEANTDALKLLTKAWGLSRRGEEALPGSLTGPQGRGAALLRAHEVGALRLGTL